MKQPFETNYLGKSLITLFFKLTLHIAADNELGKDKKPALFVCMDAERCSV